VQFVVEGGCLVTACCNCHDRWGQGVSHPVVCLHHSLHLQS
jgi:hypothetical protein